jgi:YD repeat-containing protein
MKRFSICFCFIAFLANSLHGQDVPSESEIVPPSPDAYSFAKYGDVPVSLYTGVPDISIPLVSLSDHGLSVNVSLSYHGSGIKVDEMASWVGLGWSLNAGGVITRTVKGRTDGISSNGSLSPERVSIEFYDGPESITQFIEDNRLNSAATGALDTEPDIFYYNFNGRSGKFYFDKNANPVLLKQEGIDIKWENISTNKFIITDEQGNIYEFSDVEWNTYNDGDQISAWYLSKITSPQRHEITFKYYSSASGYHYIRNWSDNFVDMAFTNPSISPGSVAPDLSLASTEIKIHKIISNSGDSIEFKIKPGQRMDYHSHSAFSLDEIVLHRADGMLKRFKLFTSYFEANNNEKYVAESGGIDLPHLNYRLRLDSIQEISKNNSKINPYKFIYYGDNDPATDDPHTLPYRLSPSQDHWGYFNDSGNAHIFPGNSESSVIFCDDDWYFKLADYSNGAYSSTIGNGANREPNAEAMKACMLKEVHYPTGGYTDFFFEPNWLYDQKGGGLRIGKITNYLNTGLAKETIYTYESLKLFFNPKSDYYNYYTVGYNVDYTTIMPKEGLESWGLPIVENINYNKDYIKITAKPQAILAGATGSGMVYGRVIVSNPGNGYTINEFATDPYDYNDMGDVEETLMLPEIFLSQYVGSEVNGWWSGSHYMDLNTKLFPYPEVFSNEWKRGVLSAKSVYSQDSILLKKEQNLYYHQLQDALEGFKIKMIAKSTDYLYAKYYLPVGRIHLKESIVTDYNEFGTDSVITSTKYFYDNFSHFQLSRKEVNRSDGKQQTTLITYPLDYPEGTPFIDSMQNNHLLAYPIEQVTYLDSGQSILSGKVIEYKTDGLGLKDKEQFLETNVPLSLSTFKFSNRVKGDLPPSGTPTAFLPDSLYHTRLTYHSYDSIGNVLSISKDNGYKTCYVWSYGGQFPIAKIINAEYSAVETALGGATAVINFRDKSYPSDTEVENFLLPLRNSFPEALISTYTYKPLEGMSSQTDPNGFITKYKYDDFGRLKLIKDQDDNIIKRYTYHYKDLNN